MRLRRANPPSSGPPVPQPDQEYKYKCNICDKSFRLENALKFHNCRTGP